MILLGPGGEKGPEWAISLIIVGERASGGESCPLWTVWRGDHWDLEMCPVSFGEDSEMG